MDAFALLVAHWQGEVGARCGPDPELGLALPMAQRKGEGSLGCQRASTGLGYWRPALLHGCRKEKDVAEGNVGQVLNGKTLGLRRHVRASTRGAGAAASTIGTGGGKGWFVRFGQRPLEWWRWGRSGALCLGAVCLRPWP